MASSIIKEEKIEIKQGYLKMPSDRLVKALKSRKEWYFVFCQIQRGSCYRLRLFYYKSKSCYKEGEIPKGFIDITTAISIGMMDQDIDGQGHIIYINTPGKTYYLSSSSCDDRSQWLLALRAYKYNDESKVPSMRHREKNKDGMDHNYNAPETGTISKETEDASVASNENIEKIRANYLVCLQCRGIDVPRQVFEWVRPEDLEIYTRMPKPSNRPYRAREKKLNIGKHSPPALENNAVELPISDSNSNFECGRREYSRSNIDLRLACMQTSRVDNQNPHSPNASCTEECVEIYRKNDGFEGKRRYSCPPSLFSQSLVTSFVYTL